MNFEFKKSLGQNFLIDNNIIKKIIECSNFEEHSLIIEVGPGAGALTKELIKTQNKVICFEIDKRLEPFLSQLNCEVIYEDFLKINIKDYIKGIYNKIYFVSNLPYYITTPIVNKVIEEIKPDKLIIMIQKEVADRFKAEVNTKEYNSLSIFIQYYYNVKKLVNVGRNSFVPKPNVDSTVLEFTKKENTYNVKNENEFFLFVRNAFKQKRKNLRNNLKDYDLEKLEKLLKEIDKDLTYRAEQLTLEDFVFIYNNL